MSRVGTTRTALADVAPAGSRPSPGSRPSSGSRPSPGGRVAGAVARMAPSTRLLGIGAVAAWAGVAAYLFGWGRTWEADLRVYAAAAHTFLAHRSPYSAAFDAHHLPFTYPPFSLFVFAPTALAAFPVVQAVWFLLDAAATCAFAYLALRSTTALARTRAIAIAALLGAVATLALEPLRSNLDFGQVNMFLMLCVVVDVVRPPGATRGVGVGLAAALKLTPLVYLAYFVLTRDGRAAVRGVVAFVLAGAAAWVVMPAASARYWFHLLFDTSRIGAAGFVSNQSWYGLLHRSPFIWGTFGAAAWFVLAAATGAASLYVAWRCARRGQTVEALVALFLCELLASPVSWTHHWSWVLLLPAVIAGRDRPRRFVTGAMIVVLAAAASGLNWISVPRWLAPVTTNDLVVVGAVLLFGWAAYELRDQAAARRLRAQAA